MGLIKTYISLTKPGIIRGNAITALAGFLLASKGHVDGWLLLATLCGLALIIASACVFNNYIDRGIDSKMARTKKRALVSGAVSGRGALIFASVLGLSGLGLLSVYTNVLTVAAALTGFITYVFLYAYFKRHTPFGTIVGSVSGAVPPVVGYCAVTGRFDLAALLLFVILIIWQMPHFYAIALYRFDDYASAELPVLPVARGVNAAKRSMVRYIIAFIVVAPLLTVLGFTGYMYAAVAILLGLGWLWKCLNGYNTTDPKLWGRRTFLFSLIVISIWSLTISLDSFLI